MTGKEACEYIAKYLHEVKGIEVQPEEVWNYSPTGELSGVYSLYYEAYCHYEKKRMVIDYATGNITFVDADLHDTALRD